MHTTATQSLIELEVERELVAVREATVITSIVDFYCKDYPRIRAPLPDRIDASKKEHFDTFSAVDAIIMHLSCATSFPRALYPFCCFFLVKGPILAFATRRAIEMSCLSQCHRMSHLAIQYIQRRIFGVHRPVQHL